MDDDGAASSSSTSSSSATFPAVTARARKRRSVGVDGARKRRRINMSSGSGVGGIGADVSVDGDFTSEETKWLHTSLTAPRSSALLPRWPAKAVIVDGNMLRIAYAAAVKRLVTAAVTAEVAGGGLRGHLHRVLALTDDTTRERLRYHVTTHMRHRLISSSARRDHILFTAFACISADLAEMLGTTQALSQIGKRFTSVTDDMTVADFLNKVKQIQNYPT